MLLLAADRTETRTVAALLERAGQGPVAVCADLADVLDRIDTAEAAVLAQEALAGPALARLAAWTAGQPVWSEFPVVLLAGPGGPPAPPAAVAAALRLERPVRDADLCAAVAFARRSRRRQWRARDGLTEREAIAADLRRARDRLEVVLRGAGLGSWHWNVETGAVAFDDRWIGMLGYAREEIEPHVRAWETLTHPEERTRISAVLTDHLEGRTPLYVCEHRLRHRDGHWIWVLDTGSVVERAADGRPLIATGTHLEITARKQAEQDLRDSEARLRAIIEQMPVGVAVAAAPSGELLFHNARAVALLGHPLLSSADIGGYARYGALEADGSPRPPERYPIARAARDGERVEREPMPYRRGDGRLTHFEVSAAPIRDAQGRVVLAVSTFEDVAERLRAEESQRLLASELSHRVKNTLAVVQVLAAQTLHRATTLAEFGDAFHGRLEALARAHGLVLRAHWNGVDLRALAEEELAPHEGRVSIEGPAVTLPPKQAVAMGLVLYELASNAARHGALSAPAGRLHLAWRREPADGGIRLTWRERGGRRPPRDRAEGFGTRLIRRAADLELGGRAELYPEEDGLCWELRFPAPVGPGEDHRPSVMP
ncbi:sensor histidine kinase [Rhodospirillum centenum]|uniref:histidine kinase n=1 Tax=Rhodospirillum centenum (strain ATCC 51521 / SW) TaxID=414684 RepID=B6IUG0_RHOCS|nr:HWE histidine kinase domain-containing protein [Rhodospirillum centenum]ACI99785.1 sensory box sensor histidine kinase, putative [Rhodospirillum centenum SW]